MGLELCLSTGGVFFGLLSIVNLLDNIPNDRRAGKRVYERSLVYAVTRRGDGRVARSIVCALHTLPAYSPSILVGTSPGQPAAKTLVSWCAEVKSRRGMPKSVNDALTPEIIFPRAMIEPLAHPKKYLYIPHCSCDNLIPHLLVAPWVNFLHKCIDNQVFGQYYLVIVIHAQHSLR